MALDLQLCSSIDSSHILQNAMCRLFRLAMRGVQRQGVWVWRFEHLEFLEIPQDRGQVDVLEPRSAFLGILALAYHLGVARQPHGEKSGFSLFSQSLDPAEQRLVLWRFRVEHVRKHETVVRRAEIANDGQDRSPACFDMLPGALRKGKCRCSVIADNAVHRSIDQLVVTTLAPVILPISL